MPPTTGNRKQEAEWRPVVGYEDRYEVSSSGGVRSLMNRNKLRQAPLTLRPQKGNRRGYLRVDLARPGQKKKPHYVHGLVLSAFVGPCPPKNEARRLNDKKDDNRLENLSWGTKRENMQDAVRNGLIADGDRHPCSKREPGGVQRIRDLVASGWTQRRIAHEVNLSQPQVSRILTGTRRKREKQAV